MTCKVGETAKGVWQGVVEIPKRHDVSRSKISGQLIRALAWRKPEWERGKLRVELEAGVAQITITPNDPLRDFVLHSQNSWLCWVGDPGLQRKYTLVRRLSMGPLSCKLRLLARHSGLVSRGQWVRKGVTILTVVSAGGGKTMFTYKKEYLCTQVIHLDMSWPFLALS